MVLDLCCIKCNLRQPVGGTAYCTGCTDASDNVSDDESVSSPAAPPAAEVRVVCNELLMYVSNMNDCATFEKLRDAVLGFYTDDEVKNARLVLLSLPLPMPARKSVPKMAEDIITKVRDESEGIVFVARDWKRVPKSRLESVVDIVIELVILKARFEQVIIDLQTSQHDIRNLQEAAGGTRALLDGVVEGQVAIKPPTSLPPPATSMTASALQSAVPMLYADSLKINDACSSAAATIPPVRVVDPPGSSGDSTIEKDSSNVNKSCSSSAASASANTPVPLVPIVDPLGQSGDSTIGKDSTVGKSIHTPALQQDASTRLSDNSNAWLKGPAEIKRDKRNARTINKGNATTVGTNQTSSGMKSVSKPLENRELFLFRVDKTDSIDVIKNHLLIKNITVVNLIQMNGDGSHFNSFKLTVPFKQARSVRASDFWPENVCIRNWREPSPKANVDVSATNNLSTSSQPI